MEKASYHILAIVLNWNDIENTSRCLLSLTTQIKNNFNLEILLIDNNSDTDPSDFLHSQFPGIDIIRTSRNLGVAGGRNIGIDYAIKKKIDFVFFFDNDAHADPLMIKYLLDSASKNQNAGIFGPKIYIDNSKNIIWRAGCTSWKWTYLHSGFSISKYFKNLFNKHLPKFIDTERGYSKLDKGQFDDEQNISFQIGCAQFIRTEVFRDVGLLDTRFSPYGSEDIDFCSRSLKNKWGIIYVPKAICWHRIESSFKDDFHRNFNNTKNLLILARKNLSPIYFSLLFLPDFFLFTIPLTCIKHILTRKRNSLRGFLKGIKWNYEDLRKNGVLIK